MPPLTLVRIFRVLVVTLGVVDTTLHGLAARLRALARGGAAAARRAALVTRRRSARSRVAVAARIGRSALGRGSRRFGLAVV